MFAAGGLVQDNLAEAATNLPFDVKSDLPLLTLRESLPALSMLWEKPSTHD